MSFLRDSIGGALAWVHELKEDTNARLNADANRQLLLTRLKTECEKAGFKVEMIRQSAVYPAVEVAVEIGVKTESALLEVGGENWSDIVFAVVNKLQPCDEATVFIQLEAREARAYVCCTQKRDGKERSRHVSIVDVIDPYNLADAYQAAKSFRR